MKYTIKTEEVDTPDNMWCEIGHIAPEFFKRGGEGTEPLPIRFWHVTGDGNNKIICEPCLVLVNFMAKNKAQKERDGK